MSVTSVPSVWDKISTAICLKAIETLFKDNPDLFKKDFNPTNWKRKSKQSDVVDWIKLDVRIFEEKTWLWEIGILSTKDKIISVEYKGIQYDIEDNSYVTINGKKFKKNLVKWRISAVNTIEEIDTIPEWCVILSDDYKEEDKQIKALWLENKAFHEKQRFHFRITNSQDDWDFEAWEYAMVFGIWGMDNLWGHNMHKSINYLNTELSKKFPGVEVETWEFQENYFYISWVNKGNKKNIEEFIVNIFKYKLDTE